MNNWIEDDDIILFLFEDDDIILLLIEDDDITLFLTRARISHIFHMITHSSKQKISNILLFLFTSSLKHLY